MRIVIFCCLLAFSLSSCYKRVEGCLDNYASNFNPNTDDACDGCCLNPFLRITIKHQLDGRFYNPADTVTNELGQQYKLLGFSYYLAGFVPYSADGSSVTGIRETEYFSGSASGKISDDFILVRPQTFDYQVNEIRSFGSFDSLVFVFGLPSVIRNASSVLVKRDHVLSDSLFLKNQVKEKLWCNLMLAKGDTFGDTIRIEYPLGEMETKIGFPVKAKNNIGRDLSYSLIADYSEWFKNVDIHLPSEEIKMKVKENLTKTFFVE